VKLPDYSDQFLSNLCTIKVTLFENFQQFCLQLHSSFGIFHLASLVLVTLDAVSVAIPEVKKMWSTEGQDFFRMIFFSFYFHFYMVLLQIFKL